MDQLTPEQIQERFSKLPKELQEVLQSDETLQKIRSIGNSEGLLIDQIGELVDQVVLVMIGVAKPQNFIAETSTRLSISTEKAKAIAEKINRGIFDGIKGRMGSDMEQDTEEFQTAAETTAPSVDTSVSSLERAGDFTIERQPAKETSLEDKNPVTPKDRTNLIAGLENPAPVVPRMASSGASFTNGTEPRNEPLVEQLMRTSTAIPHEKVVREPEKEAPKPAASAPTSDPYREPVV